MKKTMLLLSIVSLGIITMPVQANHYATQDSRIDRIEQRQANQRYRIHQGIDSGELVRKEVRRLRRQQRRIARLKHRYLHDGYLDRYEFRELNFALNQASKRIYRLKHNHRYR